MLLSPFASLCWARPAADRDLIRRSQNLKFKYVFRYLVCRTSAIPLIHLITSHSREQQAKAFCPGGIESAAKAKARHVRCNTWSGQRHPAHTRPPRSVGPSSRSSANELLRGMQSRCKLHLGSAHYMGLQPSRDAARRKQSLSIPPRPPPSNTLANLASSD